MYSEDNMNVIHVSGGGHNQVKLCCSIIECGYLVALSDPDTTCECKSYATYFQQIDITRFQSVYDWARSLNCIYSLSDSSDIGLRCSIFINQRIEFNSTSVTKFNCLYNKSQQYKFLIDKSFSVNLPSSIIVKSINEIKIKKNFVTFPAIIKPVDSQGSKGVLVINNYDQLLKHAAKSFNKSSANTCIIQSLINGPEVSIDSIKSMGQITNLCFGIKTRYSSNPCLDQRITFLRNPNGSIYNSLKRLHAKILEVIQVDNSQFHVEYIYSLEQKKWYLIEFAGRGGGGGISSYIIKYISKFNPQFYQIMSHYDLELSDAYCRSKTMDMSYKDDRYCTLIFTPQAWSYRELCIRLDKLSKKFPDVCILDYSKNNTSLENKDSPPEDSSDRGNFVVIGSTFKAAKFQSLFEKSLLNYDIF